MHSLNEDSKLVQYVTSAHLQLLAANFEFDEALNKQRYEGLKQRFADAEKLSTLRYETLLRAIQSASEATQKRIDDLERNLFLDRRLRNLEAQFGNREMARDERQPVACNDYKF